MSTRLCPNCMARCNPQAKFCTRCRHPLTIPKKKTCANGHVLDPSWSSCPYCANMSQTGGRDVPAGMGSGPRQQSGSSGVHTVVEARQPAGSGTGASGAPAGQPSAATVPAQELEDTGQTASTELLAKRVAPTPPPAQQRAAVRRQTVVSVNRKEPAGGKIAAVLATFTWKKNGQAFLLRTGRSVIGSDAPASIRVPDPKMSAKHAVIGIDGDSMVIDDCLSTNGTLVNGRSIMEKTPLRDGDTVQTGDTLWRITVIKAPEET